MRRPTNSFKEQIFPFITNAQRESTSTTNLRRAILQVLDEFDQKISSQGIQTSVDVPESVEADIDGAMFCSVLRTVCRDAIGSMETGGELSLTVYADPNGIELEIADSRSGHLSTKKEYWIQSNLDPGSQNSRDVIADAHHFATTHGGSLKVQNCPEGGAAFTICLPSSIAVRNAA